jgi:hypothetical protein
MLVWTGTGENRKFKVKIGVGGSFITSEEMIFEFRFERDTESTVRIRTGKIITISTLMMTLF